MIRRLFLCALVLFVSGCEMHAPEELDRLTKEDPAFKQMIAARDQMHSQIRLIKDDLLEKKKAMDAQIGKLRQDYDVYAKAQTLKVEKCQNAIDANRKALKNEIETASAQLEAKQTELQGYEKTLGDVRKVLHESKSINLSAQEKQKWEERVLMLSEKIRPLTEELQELKLQIRLKKSKISFLR